LDTKEGMPFHTDKSRHIVGEEPSHYPRTRHNIEMMLDALENLLPGVLDPKYLLVRFGHAAHARPAQAARMKQLGVAPVASLPTQSRSHVTADTCSVAISKASRTSAPAKHSPRRDRSTASA